MPRGWSSGSDSNQHSAVEQIQRLIWEHKQVSLREFAQFVQFAASSAATA
jgi:hypothetical protein